LKMRVREQTPDAVFKGFCAIAFSLFVSEKKLILSYLLFGMGFGWLAFMVCENMGWIEVERASKCKCKCKEVRIHYICHLLNPKQGQQAVTSSAEKDLQL